MEQDRPRDRLRVGVRPGMYDVGRRLGMLTARPGTDADSDVTTPCITRL
jgi:hypothetical protein